MSKFVSPFTDYGFKLLFGQEVSKDLLIDFLNNLLLGEKEIKDLTFLNTEQLPEQEFGRIAVYDVYCTTSTGEHIIVEMQNRYQERFRDRALFYLSRAIVNQAKKGAAWRWNINAVYGVFLMNFSLDSPGEKVRTDVALCDTDTGKQFSDKLRQIYISLPRFTKTESECETDFERWLYILKHMEAVERLPFESQKLIWQQLAEKARISALTPQEHELYEESWLNYCTNMNVLETAKEEGLAEGRAEGREEGLAEGLKEGRAEGEARLWDAARNLKSQGVPITVIGQATGLSEEELTQL